MRNLYEIHRDQYTDDHPFLVTTFAGGRDRFVRTTQKWVDMAEEYDTENISDSYAAQRREQLSQRLAEKLETSGFPNHIAESAQELTNQQKYDEARRLIDEGTYNPASVKEFVEEFVGNLTSQ